MAGDVMIFGMPHWLKRAKDTARALVKYVPPPAAELTDADEANGWTAENLGEYHAERNTAAMAVVAARMDAMRRPPRPRWANSSYSPLRWRG